MRPPRWLERLAAWRFGDESEQILGDLAELASERAPRWPRLWTTVQVFHLLVRGHRRGAGGWGLAGSISEVRVALRSAVRSPVVSLTIVGTLALAIGATTAIFSVVDAVVLRSLPVDEPESLAAVFAVQTTTGDRDDVSPADLVDFRTAAAFDELAGWTPERYALTGSGEPTQILIMRYTDGLFTVLRSEPALGRIPSPEVAADEGTVVLTHGFWSQRFEADPRVIGRTITLDDRPYEVVGVLGPDFRFPDDDRVAAWMPLFPFPWEADRWTRHTDAIGRLAPGASIAQAQSELQGIAAGLAESSPRTNEGWSAEVVAADALRGSNRTLPLLMAVVGVVLIIACLNVANLLLARTMARGGEWEIRGALGAGRGRLVRQLLVESGLYAVLGCLSGLALAHLGLRALLALDPGAVPRWNPIRLDGRVVAFTASVGVLTTLLVGLWPAARAGRAALWSGRSTRSTGDRGAARIRSALSTAQVAFAVLLSTSAGLLISSLVRLQDEAPGYRVDQVLSATIELPGSRYAYGSGLLEQAFADIRTEVEALPGVLDVGWVTALPLDPGGTDYDIDFFVADQAALTPQDAPPSADFRVASEGYLEAMGIPLLRGRTLEASDSPEGEAVVLVNQALVDRHFEGVDPIGRGIHLYEPAGEPYRIVGVVGNVRHRGLDDAGRPEIYVPYRLMAHDAMTLVVHTDGDPSGWGPQVRDAIHRVDPELPLIDLATMESRVDTALGSRRFGTSVLFGFAALGLLLALVGVNGTLSYSVQRRQREIGVRLALGEGRDHVVLRILADGGRVVFLGLLLGLAALIPGTRVFGSLLYGVGPADPATLLTVTGGVAVVGLLACLFPALRAARMDPAGALRRE